MVTYLGFLAAILTTTAFLPQVFKTLKTKKTKDLSLIMYILLTVGTFLWGIYGFLNHDIPLVLANVITFLSSLSILILKVKHDLPLILANAITFLSSVSILVLKVKNDLTRSS